MDEISARSLEAFGAAIERQRKDEKTLGDAMIRLIETSGEVGRQPMPPPPPDATFHTYA